MKKILALLLFLIAGNTNATLISFTDRASFNSLAGITSIENFESFAIDTYFHTNELKVGNFTLSMTGTPSTIENFIDVKPAKDTDSDVNGSNNIRAYTQASTNLKLEFDTAITAFGADFRSLNDNTNRTQLMIGLEILTLPLSPSSGLFTFFGFTSDIAVTTVIFQGIGDDIYGIDNLTFKTPIPVPATFWLFFSIIAGLFGIRRKINTALQ